MPKLKTVFLTFNEAGIPKTEKDRKEIIQIACNYLMARDYPEFNECDVIPNYDAILIADLFDLIAIPVNRVYKPEYLH